MGRKLDESRVVWIPPEAISQERRAEIVKRHRGDADSLIEKLDELEREITGQYRLAVVADDDPNTGTATRVEGGYTVVEYEDDLLVFTDDGYEVYDPAKHGEPYAPIPSRRGQPAVEAPRVEED